MGLDSFEDSRIWQASTEIAVCVYQILNKLPTEEKYAMSSQIRRAVVSVSTNIAEGFGRTGSREKIQFYNIAYGSLLETKSLLILAVKLGFFLESDIKDLNSDIVSLQKQLNATKTAVRARIE